MTDFPRVALVETSELLPGLLPFQAWDALGTAERVLLRDPDTHPSASQLYFAGLDLVALEPMGLDRGDLDLNRPGAAEDRRMAKALLHRALEERSVAYLLGPGDQGIAPALAGMAAEHDLEIELVFLAQQPQGTELLRTVEVVRALRDPEDGCPWDLEQDHGSLVRYLVEEAYELVDAIERDDDVDIREELGDVLLQVLLHARVAADRGAFGIDDVASDLAAKLVRRHPHVFADGRADSPDEVQRNWDQLKAVEKDRQGVFDGVAAAAPGLSLLAELQRKAAKRGYRWQGAQELAALREHVDELLSAVPTEERTDRLGEVLAAVSAVARQHDVDAEAAARSAGRRFRTSFESAHASLVAEQLDPLAVDEQAWGARLSAADPGPGGRGGPRASQ